MILTLAVTHENGCTRVNLVKMKKFLYFRKMLSSLREMLLHSFKDINMKLSQIGEEYSPSGHRNVVGMHGV